MPWNTTLFDANGKIRDERVGRVRTASGAPVMAETGADSGSVSVSTGLSFVEGDSVTITTEGAEDFGSVGPTIELFDDFASGTPGEVIPLTSPKVGLWAGYGQSLGRPHYHATARSGGSSQSIVDSAYVPAGGGNMLGQFQHQFTAATEVFVSYAVRLPNKYFSGASTPSTLPNLSCWKFIWLFNTSDGYGGGGTPSDANTCVPTYWSNNTTGVLGNSMAAPIYSTVQSPSLWFSFDNWTRISYWAKADPTNPTTVNGKLMWQTVSADKGFHQDDYSDRVAIPAGSTGEYDYMTVPGWWGNGTLTNFDAVYDDFYFATGPGSAARVEIGDNEVYSSCTDLAICTPTSWGSSSITFTARCGAWSQDASLAGKYLFVHDANNNLVTTRLIS